MTDPVTRLSISHTLSFSYLDDHACILVIVYFYSYFQLYCCLFGAYPHFRDFHTRLCGLLLVWTTLVSICRRALGAGLGCALEFRVVEFSRVSDPLRRIRYLRSDVNGSR